MNAVRRSVQTIWNAPVPRPRPVIHLIDEDGDRNEVGEAYRTIASEMGLRYIRLDLASGLTDDHRAMLDKAARNPRLIIITSIDGMPETERATLHDILCDGASRTLPVVVCFMPKEAIDSTMTAWHELSEIEKRIAKDREAALKHGIEKEA